MLQFIGTFRMVAAVEEAGAAGILGIDIVPVVAEVVFAARTAGMFQAEGAEEEKNL